MVSFNFIDAWTELRGEIGTIVGGEIYELEKKVRRVVDREHANVFKLLARKGIDVPKAPNLGKYTPTWAPLTNNKRGKFPGYVDWKKKNAKSANFYKKTGDLETKILGLDPRDVLGKPQIHASTGGTTQTNAGFENVSIRRVSSRGKVYYQNQTRDLLLGRFGPKKFRTVTVAARFTVQMLPNFSSGALTNGAYKKPVLELLKSEPDQLTYWKLVNPREQGKRPLIGNFLLWWVDVHIRNKIERFKL